VSGKRGPATKNSYAECTSCSSLNNQYSSASEALDHLHTVHFECSLSERAAHKTKDRPYDDPCYAFVQSLADTPAAGSAYVAEMTKGFIENLLDISGKLNKLYWLVTTNSRDNQHRQRRGAAAASAHHRRSEKGSPPAPRLPRSLVYVFDELVTYYVLGPEWHHYFPGRFRGSLGRERIDTTSLKRVLTVSVLDNTLAMSLTRRTSHTNGTMGSDDSEWDVIGVYKEYSNQLYAEAAGRSRRRLFLTIHALEDELKALRSLLYAALWDIDS